MAQRLGNMRRTSYLLGSSTGSQSDNKNTDAEDDAKFVSEKDRLQGRGREVISEFKEGSSLIHQQFATELKRTFEISRSAVMKELDAEMASSGRTTFTALDVLHWYKRQEDILVAVSETVTETLKVQLDEVHSKAADQVDNVFVDVHGVLDNVKFNYEGKMRALRAEIASKSKEAQDNLRIASAREKTAEVLSEAHKLDVKFTKKVQVVKEEAESQLVEVKTVLGKEIEQKDEALQHEKHNSRILEAEKQITLTDLRKKEEAMTALKLRMAEKMFGNSAKMIKMRAFAKMQQAVKDAKKEKELEEQDRKKLNIVGRMSDSGLLFKILHYWKRYVAERGGPDGKTAKKKKAQQHYNNRLLRVGWQAFFWPFDLMKKAEAKIMAKQKESKLFMSIAANWHSMAAGTFARWVEFVRIQQENPEFYWPPRLKLFELDVIRPLFEHWRVKCVKGYAWQKMTNSTLSKRSALRTWRKYARAAKVEKVMESLREVETVEGMLRKEYSEYRDKMTALLKEHQAREQELRDMIAAMEAELEASRDTSWKLREYDAMVAKVKELTNKLCDLLTTMLEDRSCNTQTKMQAERLLNLAGKDSEWAGEVLALVKAEMGRLSKIGFMGNRAEMYAQAFAKGEIERSRDDLRRWRREILEYCLEQLSAHHDKHKAQVGQWLLSEKGHMQDVAGARLFDLVNAMNAVMAPDTISKTIASIHRVKQALQGTKDLHLPSPRFDDFMSNRLPSTGTQTPTAAATGELMFEAPVDSRRFQKVNPHVVPDLDPVHLPPPDAPPSPRARGAPAPLQEAARAQSARHRSSSAPHQRGGRIHSARPGPLPHAHSSKENVVVRMSDSNSGASPWPQSPRTSSGHTTPFAEFVQEKRAGLIAAPKAKLQETQLKEVVEDLVTGAHLPAHSFHYAPTATIQLDQLNTKDSLPVFITRVTHETEPEPGTPGSSTPRRLFSRDRAPLYPRSPAVPVPPSPRNSMNAPSPHVKRQILPRE